MRTPEHKFVPSRTCKSEITHAGDSLTKMNNNNNIGETEAQCDILVTMS